LVPLKKSWLLEKHILPKLGSRPYAELRRSEIIAFIEENASHGKTKTKGKG
jgi:hypothetical protein